MHHPWTGLALAPLTTAATFQAKYMLVPFACQARSTLVLHAISAVALLISMYAMYAGHKAWTLAGGGWPGEHRNPAARNQFLGILGMAFTALMILLIVAQWAAILYLDPCTHS